MEVTRDRAWETLTRYTTSESLLRHALAVEASVRGYAQRFGEDEALVGGKGGPHKQLVLVAAEKDGRVRLAHAENNDAETCKRFADGEVAADAAVDVARDVLGEAVERFARPRHDEARSGDSPNSARSSSSPSGPSSSEAPMSR